MRIQKNTTKTQTTSIIEQKPKSYKQSFKGIDTIVIGTMDAIERGGLFASFTVQDVLGTILPRPLTGLSRNKKENKGKKNTAFAIKELIREVVTGPSMFLIPMGILAVGKKFIGNAVNIPTRHIKGLGEIFKDSITETNLSNPAELKKDFYTKTFKNMLSATTGRQDIDFDNEAKELTDHLINLDGKPKKGITKRLKGTPVGGSFEDAQAEFIKKFTNIVRNNIDDATIDVTSATIKGVEGKVPFKELVGHIVGYGNDAIEHVAKKVNKDGKQEFKKIVSEALDSFNSKRINTRFGFNVGMAAIIIAFLSIVPDLYNKTSKGNPGLIGLEETPNSVQDKKEETKTNKKNKEKASPSFGSSAGMANRILNGKTLSKFNKAIEFTGENMSFPVLMSAMTFGVFTPRIAKAKDEYDRKEIIRRDVFSILTLVFGEKIISNLLSIHNERKSGFALASEGKGFAEKTTLRKIFDYIRPIKGLQILNSQQIVSKYSDLEQNKNGILDFCDFIDKEGGNLRKLFSFKAETKEILEDICGKESFGKADNNGIIEAIRKAMTESPEKIKEIYKHFEKADNAFVKKAKSMNSMFGFISMCLLVPGLLGFAIPKWNEACTKKAKAKEKAEKEAARNSEKTPTTVTPSSATATAEKKSVFDGIKNI